jgi:hypothetical protein
MAHPYNAGVQAYQKAADEFDYFAINALASIPGILKTIPRSAALERANAFLVQRPSQISLQAWFGKRPTGRPRIDGPGGDAEIGAQLVYSLGANGLAIAILYPATSEGATAREKYLVLGAWKPQKLAERLEDHLQALVAYHYATSIDGQPTFSERGKVGWLRLVCLRQIDGQQSIAARLFFRWLAGLATRGLFVSFFRLILLVGLVLLLIWLGYDWLGALFAKRA